MNGDPVQALMALSSLAQSNRQAEVTIGNLRSKIAEERAGLDAEPRLFNEETTHIPDYEAEICRLLDAISHRKRKLAELATEIDAQKPHNTRPGDARET